MPATATGPGQPGQTEPCVMTTSRQHEAPKNRNPLLCVLNYRRGWVSRAFDHRLEAAQV